MTSDPSIFIKRIRHLSIALIVSAALNIGVLSLLLFWMLRERPPTPYCELKPASFEQQYVPLADQRGCAEMLSQLSQLSFSQLVACLSHTQLIENGYAERDLALACLTSFHFFDIQRALAKEVQLLQPRLLSWRPKGSENPISLVIYSDLTQQQFDAIMHFARTERYPLTAEGLFFRLKKQKGELNSDNHLVETFALTPEFWTVELLFNRSGNRVSKQDVLTILLDGDWTILKHFIEQQRQLQDTSEARRQKFLLDYVKIGSASAAMLLIKNDREFSVKKLDDQQIVALLKIIPPTFPEGVQFSKEILVSPRSSNVWRQASRWLYANAGESMPEDWTYRAALARFVPEKANIAHVSKPSDAISSPSSTQAGIPLARSNPLTGAINEAAKNVDKKKVVNPVALQKKDTFPMLTQQSETKNSASKEVKVTNHSKKEGSPAKREVVCSIQSQMYVVQEGDTLWKIATCFGVKVEEIKKNNHLTTDALKKGIVLKIPQKEKI